MHPAFAILLNVIDPRDKYMYHRDFFYLLFMQSIILDSAGVNNNVENPTFKYEQARKLKDAQAEKLTSLQANKLTS